MKLDSVSSIDNKNQVFKGKRVWKNTVSQLTKNNPYSLTEPNQRYISNAIKSLSQTEGKENVKFLLDSAKKLTYATNIHFKDAPKNNWKGMLLAAAATAAALTPQITNIDKSIKRIENKNALSNDEKEILGLREQLLEAVDIKQIENETRGSAKDFQRNLNYFIVSSETTLEHKKYVLERLNYLMSNEYEINPQIKDKKSVVAAEMINDMAIHTPGQKVPNIKAINQKQHGMCAAISIVRKKLAYEDKPNYVDSILSELDSSDYISVYDRSQLGSGKKIKVQKVPVDFTTALSKGYRIIDASTMHWMQIADMSGSSNIAYNEYHPFDKENFDVNTDSFFNIKIDDPELSKTQAYYQALIKADDIIGDYKARRIKKNIKDRNRRLNHNNNVALLNKTTQTLKNRLSELSPSLKSNELNEITAEILGLQETYSSKIDEFDPFSYIPNEEDSVKKDKIHFYLKQMHGFNKIDKEKLDSIFELTQTYHDISDDLRNKTSKTSMIKKARNLYEVAAAHRYQLLMGLEDDATFKNWMHYNNINNEESLVLDAIDKTIAGIEKNNSNSETIMLQAASIFQGIPKEKDAVIESLQALKAAVQSYLTSGLDNIYKSLTLKSRKDALIQYLETIKTAGEDNKDIIKNFAKLYEIKPNKDTVFEKIDSLIDTVKNGDDDDYNTVFNSLGNTSQIEYIANLYRNFVEKFGEENNDEFILEFIQANGITEQDRENAVVEKVNEIQNKINEIGQYISQCAELLKFYDKNGNILISANPKDVLLNFLENQHIVIPARKLKELSDHLTKIDKDSSTDEFQTRQGKLKDKSLYNFSASEKETLREIESGINVMYSDVHKELNNIQQNMKSSIEELKRIIGVNNGNWWVGKEGSSGMSRNMEIRVLEYITGRPHHESDDIETAIEKIKTTPYSGISTSSVYHDDFGFHAQYIADIAPVKVTIKDKDGFTQEETREVLFNDNSWGASENENVWIDSYGLKRTDYSNNRGGTLGYITNNEFRNGNFVDRILKEMVINVAPDMTESRVYKRIKHPDKDATRMPQYTAVIINGESPETKNTADSIHDTIFNPTLRLSENLKNIAEKLTEEELKNLIRSYTNAGKNWRSTYDALLKRIVPEIGKGIETKEEYDNLADNDYLKVVLEKIALKKRGQIAGLEPELAKVRDTKDLKKFKAAQTIRALNSFKYAFKKTSPFVGYLTQKWGEAEEKELDDIFKKYNIELSDKDILKIGEEFEVAVNKFNGSVKDSINEMMRNLSYNIDELIENPDARAEIKHLYRRFFNRELYFNESDLSNKKIEHIIKFIDRVYDPSDDKEFVQIYRQIQNMTNEEFKKEVLSKVTPEDLGLKNITGFDVMKKIQHFNEEANTALLNTVYYDSIVPELNSEEYNVYYKLEKFNRSALYRTVYNFNTTYREISNSLANLTFEKLFNKYKGRKISEYGAYPAYPKTGCITDELLMTSFNSLDNILNNNVSTIRTIDEQIQNYGFAHRLTNYVKKLDDNSILSDYQYKNINYILGSLITLNFDDTSISDILECAEKALELPKGTPWSEYKVLIEPIIQRLTDFENTSPKNVLELAKKNDKQEIDVNKKAFATTFVQRRYHANIYETMNKLEQAYIRNNPEQIEILRNKLYEEFTRYHILQNPEELLQTYIKSCAKDSELNPYNSALETLLKRGLNFAKLAEMEEILMDAVKDGVELNAKSLFDNYNIELEDGTMTMGSDQIIGVMVNKLVLDNQFNTALMFIEKLGIGDAYINELYHNINFDDIKGLFKNAYEIANNFEGFKQDFSPYLIEATNILKADDSEFLTILNSLKKVTTKLAKKYSIDKDTTSIMLKTLDSIKDNCNKNENAQKHLIFTILINQAQEQIANSVQTKINGLNEILQSSTTIMNIANQIPLLKDSNANKQREEMNAHFKEILEYKNQLQNSLQESEESDKI